MSVAAEFTVLTVCRANQYRSVVCEHVLRSALDELGSIGWRVSSAGTAAAAGRAMDPLVAEELVALGISPDPRWTSQPVSARLLARADLVLTSDRSRSAEVSAIDPRSARKIHTVAQWARFLRTVAADGTVGGTPLSATSLDDGLRDAVRLARGHLQPVAPHRYDIQDPSPRPKSLLRPVAQLIAEDMRSVATGLVRLPAVAAARSSTSPPRR